MLMRLEKQVVPPTSRSLILSDIKDNSNGRITAGKTSVSEVTTSRKPTLWSCMNTDRRTDRMTVIGYSKGKKRGQRVTQI
jgi:hypothetical protein